MKLRPEKTMVISGAACMLVANVCFMGWVITRDGLWAAWAFLAMIVSLVIPLVQIWIPRGVQHLVKRLRARKSPGATAG